MVEIKPYPCPSCKGETYKLSMIETDKGWEFEMMCKNCGHQFKLHVPKFKGDFAS